MRVPLSWVTRYAPLTGGGPVDATEVARRLTAAGLEVESVEPVGADVSGVVVAEVTGIEELAGFKKPVRYCQVSTPDVTRGVICGAVNFEVGDRVPLALPGAVLPGGFEIGAQKKYGHLSDGMICSARELGIGEDHTGILVLAPGAPLGDDFVSYAGLRDHVLDISVNPDRGYALSIRGVARELATAFAVGFTDPAEQDLPGDIELVSPEVHPASIDDPSACDRFVLREVRGFDPAARTPLWMRVALARAGLRTVSLAVDITNYLMLELGQPLHAFDAGALSGPIVVRRARPGERLETLDHVQRDLDPDDILITDSSGPISLAGTMGGTATEISAFSRDLVIEAAHFSPRGIARMSRRHRLFSEASYRFERGVDPELPLRASARAVSMLASLGGAGIVEGCTDVRAPVPEVTIRLAAGYPGRVAGQAYSREVVLRRLRDVGCEVRGSGEGGQESALPPVAAEPGAARDAGVPDGPGRFARQEPGRDDRWPGYLTVVPPSWRPDLRSPSDLAEEIIRLEGYENIPVRMPRAAAGRGLTGPQRLRRAVGRALAAAGYVEVISQPFGSADDHDRLHLPADDTRRAAPRVANPLSEDEPLLRTTLLPGLLRTAVRNLGRGFGDLALYEMGVVFRLRPAGPGTAPILRVDRGPAVDEVSELEAALPLQPMNLAVVLTGDRERAGWWGRGRPAGWQDAIDAARAVGRASLVPFRITAADRAPWHPGRCAAMLITSGGGHEVVAGHAGELHPAVTAEFRLPPRTCVMELDLSVIEAAAASMGPAVAPVVSAYPVATQDVALVVPASVPSADVEAALVAGAADTGEDLLEEIRLFDAYTGEQAGAGHKSLAYTLRFRARDRTLTVEETTAARDAAVAEAARRLGAVQRGAAGPA